MDERLLGGSLLQLLAPPCEAGLHCCAGLLALLEECLLLLQRLQFGIEGALQLGDHEVPPLQGAAPLPNLYLGGL